MSASAARCDVLIAGGGPAGLLAGALLRDLGLDVQICERGDGGAADARSIALSESSRRALATAGLWEGLGARAAAIAHIDVSQQRCFGTTRVHAAQEGLAAFGHVVAAADLVGALRRAVAGDARCAYRTDTEVRSAQLHDAHVQVVCRGPHGTAEVSARLLVVADGGNSALRAQLGIETDVRDGGQSALTARLRLDRPDDDWAYERFTPEGPLALLPHPHGGRAAVWARPRRTCRAMRNWTERRLREALERALGPGLGAVREVSACQVFDLVFQRARARTANRCVLLGDAACSVHPVAAQGFNLVVRDAAWLAQACAGALRAGTDLGDAAMLHAYARARDADARRVARFTDFLDRGFRGGAPWLRGLRGGGLFALECLPALRARLVRFGMGADLPQSELARGVRLAAHD